MEYQNMSLELNVPTEWPFQQFRNEILRMTLRSILYYAAGQQVILTTNNVSVRLIPYEFGIGYIFRRIEELPDNFFQMDLIIPSEIMLLFNGETSVIPIEAENLEFHSRNLEGRREVSIAVPNFRRILEMKNIVGNQIYRSTFMSTYRNIGIIEFPAMPSDITSNALPSTIAHNSGILCCNMIPQPKSQFLEILESATLYGIYFSTFLLLVCLFFIFAENLKL